MSARVHIPPELFECVLDELADDPPSLLQCAVVCHHFAVHSQKLLFKRIVLGRPSRILIHELIVISSPADNFYDHIQKFPHLRRLVQDLVITDDRERKFYREDKSWIRQDRTIARILPLLEDLQGLEIQGNQKGNRLNFKAWRAELKSAILLKIPSLARLSLFHMRSVPLQMLSNVPKLRTLTLHFVLFAIEVFSVSSMGALQPFNINSHPGQEWFSMSFAEPSCPLDLTHLTTLDIGLGMASTRQNLDLITRLINECPNTLKNLGIAFSEEVTSPALYNDSYLDLGSFPALRTLFISGFLWSRRTCDQKLNAISWLVTVLGEMPLTNTVEQINLSLVITEFKDISRSGFGNARWDDFVEILLRLSRSSSVILKVTIYNSHGSYVVSVLKERLAPLTGRVEFSLDLDDSELSDSE